MEFPTPSLHPKKKKEGSAKQSGGWLSVLYRQESQSQSKVKGISPQKQKYLFMARGRLPLPFVFVYRLT